MNYIKLKKLSKNESGMYGLSASASKFNKNYPEYLRITDIDNFGNIPPVLPTSVDINQYPKWHKFLLSKDDIVFARTGSVGRNYFFNAENRKIVFGGYLIKFSLNTNLVIPKYVSYYCQTDSYWKQLKKLFVGSIMNNINEKQYENLTIPLLAKTSQQHIVNIIGCPDSLIENLVKQNSNLFKCGITKINSYNSSTTFLMVDIVKFEKGFKIDSSNYCELKNKRFISYFRVTDLL